MNRRIRDLLVAVFVLGGIGLAVFAYFWFSGRISRSRRYPVTVYFAQVGGLRVGDPVQVLGIEKGKVAGLALDSGRVKVTILLDKDFEPTRDTRFAIRSVSYLGGDRYLMVTPGDSGAAEPGYAFKGANEALELETTFLRLDQLLTELDPTELSDQLGKAAGDLVATIDKELAAFRDDLSGTMGNFTRLAVRLDSLVGMVDKQSTAGKLMSSDSLYQELRLTNAKVQELVSDIKLHPENYVKVRFSLFK
jgi:phospholipid/cholesterol/gamma-HCH transport system substrate-binding protein